MQLKYLKNKWIFWSWLAIILIGSSVPNINAGKITAASTNFEIRLDYVLHFILYFVLAFLFINWKFKVISNKPLINIPITVFAGIAVSYLEELYQLLIPGRTYNPIDFMYNSLGVLVGISISYLVLSRKSNKESL